MKNTMKVVFAGIFGALSARLGILAVPVYLLVACNVVDYATGLMASKYRGQKIESYKGLKGIFKKVSMWLLVVVGVIIDNMLAYAAGIFNWTMPFTFLVACVVALWIICNELISILENINDMGVELPGFLLPLVKNIKSQVEEKMNKESGEDSE